MATYNALWKIRKYDGIWFPQGQVHSGEPTLPDAIEEIIGRLSHNGFIGEVAFRFSAVDDLEPERLELFTIAGPEKAESTQIESSTGLKKFYDDLDGQCSIVDAMKTHQRHEVFQCYPSAR